MARHMGAVRLKRASPLTMALGAALLLFIIFFLFGPRSPSPSVRVAASASTLQKTLSGSGGRSSLSSSPPPVVRYNMNAVVVTKDPAANNERILILTPMTRFYQQYWDNLLRLTYPRKDITLGFILPKDKDGNAALAALQAQVSLVQNGPKAQRFREVFILRQDFDPPLASQDEAERHKLENQRERRAAMSKARNSLLFTTLGPMTSWVLWLDADIVETPPTLIQDLASHDKPVIVPNCFQRYYNTNTGKDDERPYDFNSWQDSDIAQELASKMAPEEILLEGYSQLATYRALMAYMGNPDNGRDWEVSLEGVGGCALMVKAEVHRDGAMFPPFPFYHLIETEGFCKMARRLNWSCTGLPNYRVYHYNE